MTNRTVKFVEGTFKEILKEKKFTQLDRIPDSVCAVIIQEAVRRAAEKEPDGNARMKEFCDQLEFAADSIIAAFNGDEDADPRIKNILVFHKLL